MDSSFPNFWDFAKLLAARSRFLKAAKVYSRKDFQLFLRKNTYFLNIFFLIFFTFPFFFVDEFDCIEFPRNLLKIQ